MHNVTSAGNFHYWPKSVDRFAQGRLLDGENKVQEEDSVDADGWMVMRATGVDGHFYGYVNDRTITHTHTSVPEPGCAGLFVEGTGTLQLRPAGGPPHRLTGRPD